MFVRSMKKKGLERSLLKEEHQAITRNLHFQATGDSTVNTVTSPFPSPSFQRSKTEKTSGLNLQSCCSTLWRNRMTGKASFPFLDEKSVLAGTAYHFLISRSNELRNFLMRTTTNLSV
nr:hypothetical protein L203_01262 [Cryptococcus depauperatus CBS 7841]